jgi:glycosyltransferase involved in cell wall biosynthesis
MILSAVIPVKYPSKHMNNVLVTASESVANGVEVIVVLDTKLPPEEWTVEIDKLQDIGVTIKSGNFNNPGEARNKGLKAASGDWITFWDADDNAQVKELLSAIESSGEASMITGNFQRENVASGQIEVFDIKQVRKRLALNPGIWRFIFRRDLTIGIDFPALSIGEDQVFLAYILSKHPEWRIAESTFYNYKIGFPGQLTGSEKARKAEQQFRAAYLISEIPITAEIDCVFCENILAMNWRLSVGSLRNLGFPFFTNKQDSLYWSRVMAILRNIWKMGIGRNLRFIWMSR